MSEERLVNLYKKIYSRPRLVKALSVLGKAAVVAVALLSLYIAFGCVYEGRYVDAAKLVVMAGVPFCIVTLMRSLIDMKRPYEVIDSPELILATEGRKAGKSFPSRHVFSSFVLGTLAFSYSLPLATIILILGVYMAVERVLLGIHFVKDVLVGALIGIASGVIGLLFL